MKKKAISRRKFIQTGALTVGAIAASNALPGITNRSTTALAQTGSQFVYIPNLEIVDDGKGDPGEIVSPLQSTNIWAVNNPSMPGRENRVRDPIQHNKDYFIVVNIRNNGTAPVFNAYVDIYAARRSFGPAIPSDVLRSAGLFQLISTVITDVGVNETKQIVSSAPWRILSLDDGSSGGGRIPVVPWFIVAECFEPVTDPMPIFGLFPNPPAGPPSAPPFNIAGDRHVASHIFSVKVKNTLLGP